MLGLETSAEVGTLYPQCVPPLPPMFLGQHVLKEYFCTHAVPSNGLTTAKYLQWISASNTSLTVMYGQNGCFCPAFQSVHLKRLGPCLGFQNANISQAKWDSALLMLSILCVSTVNGICGPITCDALQVSQTAIIYWASKIPPPSTPSQRKSECKIATESSKTIRQRLCTELGFPISPPAGHVTGCQFRAILLGGWGCWFGRNLCLDRGCCGCSRWLVQS